MRVGRDETIAGVRLIKVRDFLRWMGEGSVRLSAVEKRFGCDEAQAEQILKALIEVGYIESDRRDDPPDGRYVTSDLGIQLRNAKFVRRITRQEADKLVSELLDRVTWVNERDELTHRVTEVRTFGSYITNQPDLGDVDLAVEYTPRRATHVEEAQQRATRSGKSMSNFLQIVTYGIQEVRQILKNRNPYLSIHEHEEPETLGVPYKVLFTAE